MINVEIKNNIKFPEFALQTDLMHIAQKIVIPWLQAGIESGVDLLGGAFPPNDPKTIKAKGHSQVLIGKERKLRRSFQASNVGKNTVMINLTSDRAKIGYYLQDGIRTKHGTQNYNFFGINNDMEDLAMNYLNEKVNEKIDAGK